MHKLHKQQLAKDSICLNMSFLQLLLIFFGSLYCSSPNSGGTFPIFISPSNESNHQNQTPGRRHVFFSSGNQQRAILTQRQRPHLKGGWMDGYFDKDDPALPKIADYLRFLHVRYFEYRFNFNTKYVCVCVSVCVRILWVHI